VIDLEKLVQRTRTNQTIISPTLHNVFFITSIVLKKRFKKPVVDENRLNQPYYFLENSWF
jgi:hypothetical protein